MVHPKLHSRGPQDPTIYRGGTPFEGVPSWIMTAQSHFLVAPDQDFVCYDGYCIAHRHKTIHTCAQRKVPGILDRSQKTHNFSSQIPRVLCFCVLRWLLHCAHPQKKHTYSATESARNSRPIPEDTLFSSQIPRVSDFCVLRWLLHCAIRQPKYTQLRNGKCPEFSTDPRRHTISQARFR